MKLEEGVKPDAHYIDFLKKELGDTYQEEETDNVLIVRGILNNKPLAAMWSGKARKPKVISRYADEETREKAISNFLANVESDLKWKEERKLTRDHDIKVGDIYYTNWGYDQTNIDFYEVVNVRGSRIDMKELVQDYVSYGQGGYDDEVVPIPGRYVNDKIYTVSARADGSVTSLSSFEYPTKWDGKPKYQTNAYAGH